MVALSSSAKEELEALRRRANRNAHGHISQALRLQLLDDLATFVTTIGGVVIMAGSALLLGSENAYKWVEITVAVMGSLITLAAVWQAIWQPASRSKRHQSWSAQFVALENDCRLALSEQEALGLREMMDRMRALSEQVDLVPAHRWNKLRAKPIIRRSMDTSD